MKKFSLILASRHRRDILNELLDSIMNTALDKSSLEILVVIDNDDQTYDVENLERIYTEINLKIYSRERSQRMHTDYINWAYNFSKGKYIIILNDDSKFVNRGWDIEGWNALENYMSDKPDGIVYGFTETMTGDRLCTFPLVSRKAADVLGFVMPNERKNWGADHDMFAIYTHPYVNRKLNLPQIAIQHVSHHTNMRPRDNLSHEIEKVFMTQHNIFIPVERYAEKLSAHIEGNKFLHKKSKVLVVFNICGISGKENVDYYIAALNSILNQKFSEGFQVVISSCLTSKPVRDQLVSAFGTLVSYNWITDTLPLGVTFNHTVQKCISEFGPYEYYLYVDSGVSFSPYRNVIDRLVQVMRSDNYGMVAAKVDVDGGYNYWGIQFMDDRDYVLKIGQACNLHCQLYSHDIIEAYGNLFPDIFAHHTSESVSTFMNAAINRKMVICGDMTLHHETSMDGASSGFLHKKELLFGTSKKIEQICNEGRKYGFGYEEYKKVCIHDPNKFDENGNARDENLLPFIRDNLFLKSNDFDYKWVRHEWVPSHKNAIATIESPQVGCILLSCNNPQYVKQAVQSVLDQSVTDWQLVIYDDGVLSSQGFFDYIKDHRVRVVSGQIPEDKGKAWYFNECFRNNLLQGFLITYLYDKDYFYSNAFETFVMYFRNNPHAYAMYPSQDVIVDDIPAGKIRALSKRGACIHELPFDYDVTQLVHRRDVSNFLPEMWPEGKDVEKFAGGLFLDRIGQSQPVYPIDIDLGAIRKC